MIPTLEKFNCTQLTQQLDIISAVRILKLLQVVYINSVKHLFNIYNMPTLDMIKCMQLTLKLHIIIAVKILNMLLVLNNNFWQTQDTYSENVKVHSSYTKALYHQCCQDI